MPIVRSSEQNMRFFMWQKREVTRRQGRVSSFVLLDPGFAAGRPGVFAPARALKSGAVAPQREDDKYHIFGRRNLLR